jgi:N-formylglutamate amidohydrolase
MSAAPKPAQTWETAADDAPAPFVVSGPARPDTPLIFASPHSGRLYPAPLMAVSRLTPESIRKSEDSQVDALIAAGAELGVPTIAATYARVYMDVNREPWELDPGMFEDELPPYARARTPRVAAGLGAIARIVSVGVEVYARKLSFAEAQTRVAEVHQPYHTQLAEMIARAHRRFGRAVLIDWHSMPAAAARGANNTVCDFVIGDRFGASAAPAIARLVEHRLQQQGYRVARNMPYAGGYTTEHYGRPGRGVHTLQIEMSRALYLDEETQKLTKGYPRLKASLRRVMAALAAEDWSRF